MKYFIFLSESYVKVQDIQLNFDNIDRHKSEVNQPYKEWNNQGVNQYKEAVWPVKEFPL